MNRRRLCLRKGGSQEHICLITIMFCFNEFVFTVQVKQKNKKYTNSWLYFHMFVFFDWPFPHMCTLQRMQPISLLILRFHFLTTVSSFMGITESPDTGYTTFIGYIPVVSSSFDLSVSTGYADNSCSSVSRIRYVGA